MKPTKVTIEIELENDVFQPRPEPEIARLLKQIVAKLRTHRVEDLGRIGDVNGNTVGRVTTDH